MFTRTFHKSRHPWRAHLRKRQRCGPKIVTRALSCSAGHCLAWARSVLRVAGGGPRPPNQEREGPPTPPTRETNFLQGGWRTGAHRLGGGVLAARRNESTP